MRNNVTMTNRMMPPADGLHPSILVNGRTYTVALGATVDVPDQDAFIMIANGWVQSSEGGVGITASRPVNPPKGSGFHDATLGINIRFDGKVWRNPTSGAAV
jgi:hypothetical protein